jgi:hypothetical protein
MFFNEYPWKKNAVFFTFLFFFLNIDPVEGVYYGNIEDLRDRIAPSSGSEIVVSLGDLIMRLSATSAINETQFNDVLEKNRGYGLTENERSLLLQKSEEFIKIDAENIYFYYYTFWALGFSNNNSLLEIPAHMYSESRSPIGDAKYGSLNLLNLSSINQDLINNVTLKSYRPCCDTPILALDGSHSFAALGLIEFLSSKGLNETEILKNLLIFNTYWFRGHYADIALFIEEQNLTWEELEPENILGYSYSSLESYQIIRKYFVENGLYDPLTFEYKLDFYSRNSETIVTLLIVIIVISIIFLGYIVINSSYFNSRSRKKMQKR